MAIQLPLFNPDLEPIRYIAQNGTFEFALDGRLKTFWLSQKQIAEMFDIDQSGISRHIKKFCEDRGIKSEQAIAKFAYTASDGKTYDVEHYNHNIVIYIGYRAQATKETVAFQEFYEEVFRQRLEAEHQRAIKKAQHTHAADVTGYILAGFSPAHAEKRVDMKSTIKRLNAIIIELTDAKMIGQVIGTEYRLLFGKLADELKTILHTKNIRDALPYLQLTYLDTIETSLVAVLSHKEHISRDDLMHLVEQIVTPLAQHLKTICEMTGTDVITGKKMLGRGS